MARGARRSAWTAAAVAVATFGLVQWMQGTLDAMVVASAMAALVLGGLAGSLGRTRVVVAPEPNASERNSIAEALLANIPDPVILVDRRSVVIELNPAARALLPSLKLRHPLSFALRAPEILDGIEEVLRTGQPLKVLYTTRVPTERAFEVQIGALPMPDGPMGGPVGGQPNVVLFLRDLTSARRLEAMRVDFVANASHELRTPLASLLGFIETLQGPARNDVPARERFLGIMKMQALRMTRLIDDLLSLSRIELREHVAPTQAIDLGQIVRQMVDIQTPLARDRGVDFAVEAPDGAYPILGDRDEMLRVVENLVENAVKYGGGGTVTIALGREVPGNPRKPRIILSVRDKGPGIASEHIPRLTERFYRVDVASSRAQGGTGLGLAIVKHIVNRHRGRLVIESVPDEGTIVRALLPEHRSDAAA
ncbi:ATP-binding protein [uncultured Methylobacterium sp.]|uniref:ATP-binding protein n=1 Tax=uncultured Methylobacterium sp. TaxID=157278 RepID=UPI0035CB3D27